MEIREITNLPAQAGKEEWEGFLLQCQEKTFLQSWNWGEFQKSQGDKIWRFGIFENSQLVSIALTVKISARRGSFLLVPHGPVAKNPNSKIIKVLLEELKKIANEEKVSFIRISPIWKRTDKNNKIFKDLGFRPAPLHMHPESSWKLDITKTEDELLAKMRKTARYLVKQAEKDENIKVFQSKNLEDIEVFNKIHLEVVKAQKFVPFSLDYFKKEFGAFLNGGQIAIFFAKYKNEIVAGSYEIFWSKIGF